MKRILLASAFALIGTFAMANEKSAKEKVQKEELNSKKVEAVESFAPCSEWFHIDACKPYSLCADNYKNGSGQLNLNEVFEAIRDFNDAKGCNN